MDCPVSRSHVCHFYYDLKINEKHYEVFKCDECGKYYIATADYSDHQRFRWKNKKGKEIIITNIHTEYVKSKLRIGEKSFANIEELKKEIESYPLVEKGSIIVISDIFRCMSSQHTLKNVEVRIDVLNKDKDVVQTWITAGFCEQCKKYYILRSVYLDLIMRIGTPIYDIFDEKETSNTFGNNNDMELREESILRRYGYSVAAGGPSSLTRKKILSVLIDYELITKNGIISYIDFFIASRLYDNKFQNAIFKWEEDKEFVLDYKTGEYTRVGVYAFYK